MLSITNHDAWLDLSQLNRRDVALELLEQLQRAAQLLAVQNYDHFFKAHTNVGKRAIKRATTLLPITHCRRRVPCRHEPRIDHFCSPLLFCKFLRDRLNGGELQ